MWYSTTYLASSAHDVRLDYTTRSKSQLRIIVFHAATLLDLDREVVEGRPRAWVAVFLVALEERLGGGGGVDSNGDKEDLADRTSTPGFSVKSLTCSNTLVSGTSSESTAVSAGEFSRLSSASAPSESTRVPPLAPEEVMEEDLRRCFVARMGTLKRSGDDEGDSEGDTWLGGGTLEGTLEGTSWTMSTGGEGVGSTKGEEMGSVVLSGELALRARLVRRLGLASSVAWEESGSISLALRFLRIRPPVTGS